MHYRGARRGRTWVQQNVGHRRGARRGRTSGASGGCVALQGSPSWQNLGAAERRAPQGSPSWRNLGGQGVLLHYRGARRGRTWVQQNVGHRRGARRGRTSGASGGCVALQGSPSWQNLGAAERRARQGSPSWRNLGGPLGYGGSGLVLLVWLVFLVWSGLVWLQGSPSWRNHGGRRTGGGHSGGHSGGGHSGGGHGVIGKDAGKISTT